MVHWLLKPRRAAVAACVAITIPALVGCDSTEGQSGDLPDTVRGVSMTPEYDRDAGTLLLPFDRFTLSMNEVDEIATASAVEIVLCARDAGIDVGDPWGTRGDPIYDSEPYFGPWTLDQARKFAFVPPSTDADLAANGIQTPSGSGAKSEVAPPFAGLSDAEMEKVDACGTKTEHHEEFVAAQTQDGPWIAEIRAVENRILALEVGGQKKLVDELASCYEAEGLRASDGPQSWIPLGARGDSIGPEQVAMAVTVVQCKDSLNFTERMASIHAGEQAKVVEKYADELSSERESLDRALVAARSVLRQNADILVER